MTAGDPELMDTCTQMIKSLTGRRPRGSRHTAAVQRWQGLSGSFSDGRLTSVGAQTGLVTAARYVGVDGLRYRAESGLHPDLAERLHHTHGGADPTGDRSGPPATGSPLRPFDTTALLVQLAALEANARAYDPRISRVSVSFRIRDDDLALSHEGAAVADHRELTYCVVRAVATDGRRAGSGIAMAGVSQAVAALDLASHGTDVARRAIDALDARPAPMGTFPVVIAGGRGMVMLHEACCHPLEGDEVHRGSIYAGKLGRQIASPLVSVWDDARVPGAVGSYGFDDEGCAGHTTALIRDGVLEGYLTDQLSGQQLDAPLTGNGRCATLLDAPLPRMSNTRLATGTTNVADIIADTGRGIYAEHIGGGEVVESTGAFVFRITSGYLIENGHVTAPIEETTLAGYGTDVLTGIDAVGDDPTVSAAMCGKFDQLLPVGVIGPTVRVRSLLVGGTVR